MNPLPAPLVEMPWLARSWQLWHQSLASGRLSHGWLICGARGIGKGALADTLADSLLCESANLCGYCRGCQLLAAGNHPDRMVISPDPRVIKVEQIRDLIQTLEGTAHQGGRRVVVIQQADAMNGAAANALLKTLEEPGTGVHLLLVSDAPNRLPATIISRCQRLMVTSPSRGQSLAWLGEGRVDPAKLDGLLRLFGGPLKLAEALASGEVDAIEAWRQGWQRSLSSGVLDPVLFGLDDAQAAQALKLLYIDLVADPHAYVTSLKRYQSVARAAAALHHRFETQPGLNPAAVFQQLINR
ncbi:DNA polymerase III subunit delta' [Ferrimonas sediminicola]|uniref:DNA-directed DNA polymerase n=1 Tax=Ferrimonas sediminicola TaxID=2569538 RepID=A0A4U1BH82_9GAMM|nr:DNA polymerase III subunit delta' [Ferrimonas sediminicola]TKB50404.1 DNA polymerase III subunit delta' [Ferrimonas sediminicola]